MNAQLLDGKATAADIRRELAERVAKLTATNGRPPGLGTSWSATSTRTPPRSPDGSRPCPAAWAP
ncbi:putative bifunctional protein FolD 1 [Streptomyces viridochromogenes Tue57]|uniref:Putative bifunctional protein FolD 1 n=1 Tax=Streptomyces viridochromogenes Tue57 TaxID=1160705 RepID=L8P2A8_STRVR|nr:putative bifunctional protein FolD 1 [Streptomyces viridochromogenes Tue57]